MWTKKQLKSLLYEESGDIHNKLRNVVYANSKPVNLDGYLSFEEVGSIRLTDQEREEYGYRWIDGVQLIRKGNNFDVIIWVCNEESRNIRSLSIENVPESRYEELFTKVLKALGEMK